MFVISPLLLIYADHPTRLTLYTSSKMLPYKFQCSTSRYPVFSEIVRYTVLSGPTNFTNTYFNSFYLSSLNLPGDYLIECDYSAIYGGKLFTQKAQFHHKIIGECNSKIPNFLLCCICFLKDSS